MEPFFLVPDRKITLEHLRSFSCGDNDLQYSRSISTTTYKLRFDICLLQVKGKGPSTAVPLFVNVVTLCLEILTLRTEIKAW